MWNILTNLQSRLNAKRVASPKRRRRPRFEALEQRAMMAVVDTTNFTETLLGNVGGQPTGFASGTDGSNRLFIARKAGDVHIVQNGNILTTSFSTDTVITNGECGLIGIAFDRDYVTNRYIYLFITVSSTEQQIVRYTDADNNNVADTGSRTVVMGSLPTLGTFHNGGAIGFGFDNELYWAIGDQSNNTGVDNNLTTLAAKVGRANLDGAVPNDNPHFDSARPE